MNYCAACGRRFDAVTAVVGDTTDPPRAGDFSVCLYCAHITRFDDEGNRRPLTLAERIEADEDRDIRRLVWLIRRVAE